MEYNEYKFNKYQSTLQELKLDQYPEEIQRDFIEYLNTVPFLKNLVSENRPYAKDCPRDEQGKIIVDLTNPPIIEDTDFFRPVAIYYQKHGVVTNLRPNPNPNSAFGKWIREETRRCFEGYVRPSDGAWITGDMYFFLNYCPILKVKRIKGRKGIRVPDFPDFLEGQWLKFMYIQQARDNAKHGFELAARGKGKAHPYSEKVITPIGVRQWGTLQVGDYVYGDDGLPTRITSIPYDNVTDIYEVLLDDGRKVRCTSGHLFRVIDFTIGKEVVLPLYLLKQYSDNDRPRYGIPQCSPVQYEYQSVPMSPARFVKEIFDDYKIPRKQRYSGLHQYIYNAEPIRRQTLCSLLRINEPALGKKKLVMHTNDKQLDPLIVLLARSLGLKCKLERNIVIYPYTNKYSSIVSIKHIGQSKAKCITIDNQSHCYLIDDFVVTHNSYAMASIAAKRFLLGEYDELEKKVIGRTETFIASYTKDYLNEDGVLNKFESYIDFCADNTQFPRKRLTSSINNMHWTMGYKENGSEARKGSLNEVIGISVKDSPGKLRGKRGAFIGLEEAGCHLKGTKVLMADSSIRNVEDIHLGDYVMGDDGTPRKVLKLYNGTDMMYKITLSNGDFQIVNSTHPILFKKYSWSSHKYTVLLKTAPQLMGIKGLNKGYYISKSTAVQYPHKDVPIHPYWIGLWLGDGDKSRMAVSNKDIEVLDWLEGYCGSNNFTYTETFLRQSNKCYNFNISMKNTIADTFKKYNLIGNKHLPDDYKYNSREVLLQVLAGVIDTDGTLNRRKQYYEITQVSDNKQIIDDIAFICRVLGFRVSITAKINGSKAKGAGHLNYRLRISGDIDSIPVKISRKKIVKRHTYRNRMSWSDYTFKIQPYGIGEYYGFTLDGNELFLLDDFTIVHNSFPNLMQLYGTLRPSMEDGDIVFGMIYAQGCVCAGTKVLRPNGQLVNIENIQLGDKILGYNGNSSSIEDISWLQPDGYKKCLHIRTNENNELKCSTDHPLLALNRDKFGHSLHTCSFYRANELKVGDILLIVNTVGNHIKQMSQKTISSLSFVFRNDNGKGKNFIGKSFYNLQEVTVKSIDDIGVQRVYNFTANTTHTYITNGFISSNTAGDKESDFSAAQQMMYAPRAFNMQPIPNVYDKVGQGGKEFTFFFPAYLNRNGCYNKDGISDNTKAMLQVLINRYNVKYNSSDSTLITRTIAEHPIVPQEAILKTKGSIFPVAQLNQRLQELDANPNVYDDVYVGTLVQSSDGQVAFKPTNDEPIRKWPTDDNKQHGALEIYAMPQKDSNNKIYGDRYIIGNDTVDDDTAETMSLYSVFVLDLFTDKIVAEYTGRLDYADDNYEIVRKLCLFYNATVLYESNKKGIYAYFKERNALSLLALTPEYLKDQQIIKEIGYGNKAYGVNATAAVNRYADKLTREWLIKPMVTVDNEGNEIKLPNLMFLKNRAFIQELIAYNPQGNFDRIRAFGMLMIYRQSKVIYYEGDLSKSVNEIPDKDYAGEDDFFKENYDDNPRVNY